MDNGWKFQCVLKVKSSLLRSQAINVLVCKGGIWDFVRHMIAYKGHSRIKAAEV